MNSAIILAGGTGSRINSKIPKQFIEFDSKKVIDFSITAFKQNKNIDEIILVLNKIWIDKLKNEYKDCILIEGGKSRSQSSLNGIYACSKKSNNILIHDAARPLLSQKIIDSCIYHLDIHDAVTPFIDISDSLIEKDKNIIKYINRDLIKSIQTPQGFKKNIIFDALKSTNSYGTDDISTLLNYYPLTKVKFFEGDENNFKITRDIDLKIFESILNEK
jgi:2-C-methyl-D-erythritol 4-phosphate cytidylyltransferase